MRSSIAPRLRSVAIVASIAVGGSIVTRDASAQPRPFEGERAVTSDPATAEAEVAPRREEPASPPAKTAMSPAPAATPKAEKPAPEKRLPFPRLVIAGGPIIGPHAFGTEECRSEEARCETHGTFLGLGVNIELRARLWRPIYAHVRGILSGNVSPRDPVHRGVYGGGLGIGAYGRRIFGRAEYLLVDTFGNDRYARPFGDGELARDQWGHHAGLFSAGARLPLPRRFTVELWGGLMVGPQSTRTIPGDPVERRPLLTFLVGINIAYDLIPARAR